MDSLFFLEGQLCAWVRTILTDSRGQLWFGTNHYGLMHYDGDTLRYYNEKSGLGSGRINCFTEDKKGNLWIGTYNGLSKYSIKENADSETAMFSNYKLNNTEYDNDIWDILIENDGTLWLATNAGIKLFDGKEFTDFPIPNIAVRDTNSMISYDRINCILKDKDGLFWFGRDGFGICQYDPRSQSFNHLTTENGLCDNNISDLMEDSHENIWIGTMFGGMSRFNKSDKSFTNFTKDGLTTGIETSALYEDKEKNIWYSAENDGIYRYDSYRIGKREHRFTKFDTSDGLESLGIITIKENNTGGYWLGGWGGLFRYDGEVFTKMTIDGPWR